jgi:S-adenosylhomocysteine hydrolase
MSELDLLRQEMESCREREEIHLKQIQDWQTNHDIQAKEFRDFIRETVKNTENKITAIEERFTNMSLEIVKIQSSITNFKIDNSPSTREVILRKILSPMDIVYILAGLGVLVIGIKEFTKYFK